MTLLLRVRKPLSLPAGIPYNDATFESPVAALPAAGIPYNDATFESPEAALPAGRGPL